MATTIRCTCGKTYEVTPERAGKKAKCKCGGALSFPQLAEGAHEEVESLALDDIIEDEPARPHPLPAPAAPRKPAPLAPPKAAAPAPAPPRPAPAPPAGAPLRASLAPPASLGDPQSLLTPKRGFKNPPAAKPAPPQADPLGVFGGGMTASKPLAPLSFSPKSGESFLERNKGPLISCGIATALLLIVLVIARQFGGGGGSGGAAGSSSPTGAYALTEAPLPSFPERSPAKQRWPGVEFSEVRLNVPAGAPGKENRVYIYTPVGQHAPRSLPCVFIAPAGSTMLHGMGLGEGDQPEHIPYAQAGFAVIAYELDGPPPESEIGDDVQPYKDFSRAMAGLVNARNALEFALAKVPEIDPNRLYTAGHSSAGTTALLFAMHEPRIKGCVAYAPVSDVVERLDVDPEEIDEYYPGASDFMVKSSPMTHVERLQCPVFLFHATGDDNVPVQQSIALADRLRQLGKNVTLSQVPGGDHYESMISPGISQGIAWLRQQAGVNSAPAPSPTPGPTPQPEASNPTPPQPVEPAVQGPPPASLDDESFWGPDSEQEKPAPETEPEETQPGFGDEPEEEVDPFQPIDSEDPFQPIPKAGPACGTGRQVVSCSPVSGPVQIRPRSLRSLQNTRKESLARW